MGNMLFFGAGASHGIGNVDPESPPLGTTLYSKLVQKYNGTWGKLPNSVASIFNEDFEKGMETLWKNISKSVPSLMQNMGCYFSEFKLDGSKEDLYSKIVGSLVETDKIDEYVFSTINYECLIENALNQLGRKVSYGPNIVQNPNISTLWKIHGSCNFVVKGIEAQKGNMRYTSGALFHGNGIKILTPSQVPNYCETSALYPCMSLYAPGKPNQMARPTIELFQQNWQSFISNAEKIFIIGANPYPPDNHIWEHFSKSSAYIYYIGNSDAFLRWAQENREEDTFKLIGEKIEECFDDLLQIL